MLPGLPHDLGFECLTRLPYSDYPLASRVSRQWCHLLQSDNFYHHRKKSGHTRKLACLIQALPQQHLAHPHKPTASPAYAITVFDPISLSWDRIAPVPDYPFGLPLFCQPASYEGKLVVMGGWDPVSYEPVTDVFVYDFRRSEWKKGKNMPSKRSFFAIGAHEGRVYVAGGHDENKNALKTAWVYDLGKEEWRELESMREERDECEGRVVGDELWVVSGYRTERQGQFEGTVEAYGFGSGKWRRMEGMWEAGRSPRLCGGGGKDGSWGEVEGKVGVGVCVVRLGSVTMATGSEYQGAPHAFYLHQVQEGQNCKFTQISAPPQFSGFVQSGCCLEI
ncbi:F-box/kelch-repeat protein [Senna tora]|uniref:F-box/kelch-repeat protein n=1 Tax=Senna tora TaxID=362788 RepID=A0A834X1Z5_9FABA|nr:F-box/kelch-repeat protein [Senna tora]